MEQKERLIIETAIKFFSAKGYFTTSMQEIAEECGISKGSLYKVFESKEALLVSVFTYYHHQMFEKANDVSMNASLPPKEKLIKQISIQMNDIVEKKEFILLFFKDIQIKDKQKIKPLMQKMKSRIMIWQKEILLDAFGSDIEKYIWDIVLFLQGVIKEYLFISIETKNYFDNEQVATFIVDRLEAMIDQLLSEQPAPLMSSSIMHDFLSNEFSPQSKNEKIIQSLEGIKTKLKSINKDDLHSSFSIIEEEIQKKEPRYFLIEALLTYLEKEPILQYHANNAKTLLKNEHL